MIIIPILLIAFLIAWNYAPRKKGADKIWDIAFEFSTVDFIKIFILSAAFLSLISITLYFIFSLLYDG